MATLPNGSGIKALAVTKAGGPLEPIEIGRPAPGPHDVHIQIHYCGQCHSDIHATNGDWGIQLYPMAPGHEIAGTVIATNSTKFEVGQRVGVGCMVESCRACDLCDGGLEQHCPSMTQTYSSMFPAGKDHEECAGYHTNGGYSQEIVVHEHFVFGIPDSIDLAYAGPLLCAGITTYSPLNRLVKGKKDQKVGVIGLGGLGMMAVKIAKAMGAEVTVFSRNLDKKEQAEKLGATLVSHADAEGVQAMARTLDTLIDTVACHHDVSSILNVLKVGGTCCFLGGVPQPYEISAFQLLFSRYSVCGSLIGGVPETQEMLDFCAEHKIVPDIDVIHANKAAETYKALEGGKFGAIRSVIDMSTIGELY